MYFPLFMLHRWGKSFICKPNCSEVPYEKRRLIFKSIL